MENANYKNNDHLTGQIVEQEPKKVTGMSKRSLIIQSIIVLLGLCFIVAAIIIFFVKR